MRILHCIPSLVRGGAERQLSYVAPALARLGHEVHICYTEDAPDAVVQGFAGVTLHRLRIRGNHDPRLIAKLVRLMLRVEPDVVQTWILQMDVLAGIACSVLRRPWVMREPSCAMAWPPTAKNRLRVWVGRRAHAVVSNSRGGDAYWQQYVGERHRFVIPNALPWEDIEAAAPCGGYEAHAVASGVPLLVYAGRFDDQAKNTDALVQALVDLHRRRHFRALLFGDGPGRSRAQAQVEQKGLGEAIRLPGRSQHVWPAMKAASAFVSVSLFEGQPNAVLEAMACGCPLVVSDIPAHREILDESSALLVDPRDPAAVAAALEQVLANPAQARARAERARGQARRFALQSVAGAYEALYRSIVERDVARRGMRRSAGLRR